MEGDGDATLRFDWKLFETKVDSNFQLFLVFGRWIQEIWKKSSEMCEWNDFGRFEDITNVKTAEQQTTFKRSQMDNMP